MTTNKLDLQLPKPQPLLGRRGWAVFLSALIVVCGVAPALNLLVPGGSAWRKHPPIDPEI